MTDDPDRIQRWLRDSEARDRQAKAAEQHAELVERIFARWQPTPEEQHASRARRAALARLDELETGRLRLGAAVGEAHRLTQAGEPLTVEERDQLARLLEAEHVARAAVTEALGDVADAEASAAVVSASVEAVEYLEAGGVLQ